MSWIIQTCATVLQISLHGFVEDNFLWAQETDFLEITLDKCAFLAPNSSRVFHTKRECTGELLCWSAHLQAEESSKHPWHFLLAPTNRHNCINKRFWACLEEFKMTSLVLLIGTYVSTGLYKRIFLFFLFYLLNFQMLHNASHCLK